MKKAFSELNSELESPLALAESAGHTVCAKLNAAHRSSQGQYLTPPNIATFLAGLFDVDDDHIRLLDPGAGVGALSAAFVEVLLTKKHKPRSVHLMAWEVEASFIASLNDVLEECVRAGSLAGISVSFTVNHGDFLRDAASLTEADGLFKKQLKAQPFTHAILNPPYRKINTDSSARRLLRQAGMETSNLYTGFLWLAARLLAPGGQMVAINPRSFCNGPYFLSFRKQFFAEMTLERVHVFNRRDTVFSKDDVLQENLIFTARRGSEKQPFVLLSNSAGVVSEVLATRRVPRFQVLEPSDRNHVLHFALDETDDAVKQRMRKLPSLLGDLGLGVSTGRVVDFRARQYLCESPREGAVPLIYPMHFNGGGIHWPRVGSKKPNALVATRETDDLLVSNGVYVLVKRFTAKEERKRVVATVFQPKGELANFQSVGFENHLNYFYCLGKPMDEALARGLAIYLNSSLVDAYFRQFSGHTQVNATDLRGLRYPSLHQLRRLSREVKESTVDQEVIDKSVDATL